MKKLVLIWVVPLTIWVLFAFDSHAEVRVNGQKLSANLRNTSLANVMNQIEVEAGINVTVFTTSKYTEATISAVFEEIPLELGLGRLLNGWNYALSKDPITGTVKSLIVVSRRMGVEETNITAVPTQIVLTELEGKDSGAPFEEEQGPDFLKEKPFQTDEELLSNAPPDVREFITRMQGKDEEE